jgi:hypothetical protein
LKTALEKRNIMRNVFTNFIGVTPWSCLHENGTNYCNWVGEWSYLRYVCSCNTSTPVASPSHSVSVTPDVLYPSSRLTSQKGQYGLRILLKCFGLRTEGREESDAKFSIFILFAVATWITIIPSGWRFKQ